MKLFKNDWLSFHYNLNTNQYKRLSAWDVFTYTSKCEQLTHLNFKTELEITCKDIYATTQKLGTRLSLFLSGGVDSEIIARTFIELGIPFESYFILFHKDLNAHEKEIVDKFQTQTGCRVDYIDVDIEKWLTADDGLNYFRTVYKTFDIATPLQLWARTAISKNHSVVSGLFEPHLHKIAATEECRLEWMHAIDESSVMSRVNFIKENNFFDFPFFYLHRPELYAAYCRDPYVERMLANPYKLSLVSTKKEMMKHYFPNMEIRPKYTGFENVREQCRQATENYKQEFIDGQLRILHRNIGKLFNEG